MFSYPYTAAAEMTLAWTGDSLATLLVGGAIGVALVLAVLALRMRPTRTGHPAPSSASTRYTEPARIAA